MKILVNGASYCIGTGNLNDHNWPDELQKLTNCHIKNIAIGGGSVEIIVRTTIVHLLENNNYTHVIIVFPCLLNRYEPILINDIAEFRNYSVNAFPENISKDMLNAMERYAVYVSNDVDNYYKTLMGIHHLICFLKTKKLKYYMLFDGIPFYSNINIDSEVLNTIGLLKNDTDFDFNHNIYDLIVPNINETIHPNEIGNEIIAKHMLKQL